MKDYVAFSYSVQGYNHVKNDKVGQDASGHLSTDDVAVIAVADGHGSDNYPRTDRGSKYAVSSAIGAAKEFYETVQSNQIDIAAEPEDYLEQLAKRILANWHEQVDQDIRCEPLTEDELSGVNEKYRKRYQSGRYNAKAYGTTLMLVCMTPQYWFGLQIGDGKCVAIGRNGEITEPIPWDESCQQNITTSICDSDAINEFRYYYSADIPAAIFIGSDGVDDSYPGSEELHELYRSILVIFAEYGSETGEKEVSEYLPRISQSGSGDDISIAGIIYAEQDKKRAELIKAQGEYYRARKKMETSQQFLCTAQERLDYYEDALERNRRDRERILQKKEKILIDKVQAEDELEKAKKLIAEIESKMEGLSEESEPHMPEGSAVESSC